MRDTDKKEVEIEGKKCILYNTLGKVDSNKTKSELRDELSKKKDKVLQLHLFDMTQDLEETLEGILAGSREAKDREFKFMAVGTHLDKVDESQKNAFEGALRGKQISYRFFDLSKNPRSEVIEMIKNKYEGV